MAALTFPEVRTKQLSEDNQHSARSATIPDLVALAQAIRWVPLQGASSAHRNHRRKPPRLGSPLGDTHGTRPVDKTGTDSINQLARAQGGPSSSTGICQQHPGEACPRNDGQHHMHGAHKPPGRHPFLGSDAGGPRARPMGGGEPTIPHSGPHCRSGQRPGRLSQQTGNRSDGMAAEPISLPGAGSTLRSADHGPLRHTTQLTTSSLHVPVSLPRGGSNRCSASSLAEGPSLRLSTNSLVTSANSKGVGLQSGSNHCCSALASQTVVCGPPGIIHLSAMADTLEGGHALPRSATAPGTSMVSVDRLALEREVLRSKEYDEDVILIMEASRRPSTQRIYASTWRTFCKWCYSEGLSPTHIKLSKVLRFLRRGLRLGLSPNTLRRQVAALSSVLSCPQAASIGQLPDVQRFFRGAANVCPPPIHRFPTWDLPRVLQSLTGPTYEPLRTTSLRFLSYKVAFLLAVTSARRISELAALSTRRDLCIFHSDRVVLRPDPLFLPKVNSAFHRAAEIVLPSFCTDPKHPRERLWHTLDVRRALRIYIDRTRDLRKSESLLIAFFPGSLGQRVSATTIGRWIRAVIAKAYDLSAIPRPKGITAHSTRSAAASVAWSTQVPIQSVLRAATWSSPSTFIRHYKIDEYAAEEATFGRRVLEQVCQQAT